MTVTRKTGSSVDGNLIGDGQEPPTPVKKKKKAKPSTSLQVCARIEQAMIDLDGDTESVIAWFNATYNSKRDTRPYDTVG